jgi:hypothetical protein
MRFPIRSAFVLALVLAIPHAAHAREGQPSHAFGLGLELGAPTGLAGKYYLGHGSGGGSMLALQGGIGVIEQWGDDGFHFHLDLVWHPAVLATTPDFTMPFYFGIGARILDHDNEYCWREGNTVYCDGANDDTHIGARVPIGLLMDFHNVPLDIFFELALVVDFIHIEHDDYYDHDDDVLSLNGAIGARYYF